MGYYFGISGVTDEDGHFGFSYTFFADLKEYTGGSPSCCSLAGFVLERIPDDGPGMVRNEEIAEFIDRAEGALRFLHGRERFMKTADPDLGMVSYLARVTRTMLRIAAAAQSLGRDIEIG